MGTFTNHRDTYILPEKLSNERVRWGKITCGKKHIYESGFGGFWGGCIMGYVEDAIAICGWRSSLPQLAKVCSDLAIKAKRQEWQRRLRELQLMQPDKFWGRRDIQIEIANVKDKLIWLKQVQLKKLHPSLTAQYLSTTRRKLGGLYDCRTHMDVPNRNMIEPRFAYSR